MILQVSPHRPLFMPSREFSIKHINIIHQVPSCSSLSNTLSLSSTHASGLPQLHCDLNYICAPCLVKCSAKQQKLPEIGTCHKQGKYRFRIIQAYYFQYLPYHSYSFTAVSTALLIPLHFEQYNAYYLPTEAPSFNSS